MPKKPLSKSELRVHQSACGGVLRNRRSGRKKRSLSTRFTMHLVLRARWAYGAWSFTAPNIRQMINYVIAKHELRTGIQVLEVGNAGNHLHLRVKISSRVQYNNFIRAVTGEIARKIKLSREGFYGEKEGGFWERRPFSSIVAGARYSTVITNYIKINQLQGLGIRRSDARMLIKKWSDKIRISQQSISQPYIART